MPEKLDGIALGSIAVGAGLLYAGVKGVSIPSLIQGFIQGQSPQSATLVNQIQSVAPLPAPSPGSTAPAGSPLGTTAATRGGSTADIASDALKYNGAGYVWGGAPADGRGHWDCSSFVNWVIGHDLGLAIPGVAAGSYTGKSHGPVVASWLTWSGMTTVSSPQAGDIVCFGLDTHMGIMLGPSTMISAQNPQNGTRVSGISGFGSPVTFRRYK